MENYFEPNNPSILDTFSAGELLDDHSPIPEDLIAPRILTPGGFLVFGGAPKVGKSDFMLSWLAHMAAGEPFLGMKPPRPLKIFYLQTKLQYEYLRERVQEIKLENEHRIGNNFVITPQAHLLLSKRTVEQLIADIREGFPNGGPDIIAIDSFRHVFDGKSGEENDPMIMLSFLRDRVQKIAQEVNPHAATILVHHTHTLEKEQFEEDPFQTWIGSSVMRELYTSGMILFQPDKKTRGAPSPFRGQLRATHPLQTG